MVNRVIIIGNLGNDPTSKTLESGAHVMQFDVATNESYKDKNDQWQTLTEWHRIICWNKQYLESKLKKGHTVFIEGKITHRKYQDKDGNDRYVTEIVASSVKSLEKTKNDTGTPNEAYAGVDFKSKNESYDDMPVSNEQQSDDDLPF